MVFLRRYVVLIALMFWQGGFTFYAAVVVPVGTEVLQNSPRRQGFITQEVTHWLNITAGVSLGILGWESLASRDRAAARKWFQLALWALMAGCQVVLFLLHHYLSGLMQRKGMIVLDPNLFRPAHRTYLWVHTVQWSLGLVFVGVMLKRWKKEDEQRMRGVGKTPEAGPFVGPASEMA